VELLVVTAIIVVVTSVVLANNNRFGGIVQLESLAYDIGLSIRQAQVYGISVQRFGSSTFSAGYGMHFALSSPNTYVLFADSAGTGIFDPAQNASEIVQQTTIAQGYKISDLCVTPPQTGASEICGVGSVDVIFVRPEPDAWISNAGASCVVDTSLCQRALRITVVSPRGERMDIVVEANGQISVRRTSS
jgi:hypothetical protein